MMELRLGLPSEQFTVCGEDGLARETVREYQVSRGLLTLRNVYGEGLFYRLFIATSEEP